MPDNTPKWTPGPWTYAPIPGYQYVIQIEGNIGGLKLIAAPVPPDQEAEVQANLTVASAAPELYAALEATQRILGNSPFRDAYGIIDHRLAQNAEVLAKARGEHTDAK